MDIPQVHLILGDDEFLAERARHRILDRLGPEVESTVMRAGEVTGSEIIEVSSPSLFAEDRAIVFQKTEDAGKDAADLLLKSARDPAPGIYFLIEHSGGGRTKTLVPKFSKIAEVHDVAAIKPSQRTGWVMQEFRAHGVRPTPDVVQALLESVGSDLRELASAIEQLIADAQGEITVGTVRAYYTGVAEVSGFDIADLAVTGKTSQALASTRRALQLGISPVALAAALSSKVGGIARLYSTRGGNPKQLAGTVGMAPWLVEKTQRVARRWSGESVSQAVVLMADLDAEVKGQGGDPEFAIENAVRRISELAG
ncbi:hypothetical protein B841_09970 [Corynebacterium maris DSM 45190]|uniref:DNA-directed DNA polymerase n=1 Tax=Corynebacterium maris DSM 45190 TaxID=1224163 RepID=S5TKR5_9CORY|nr:DNA polymerase III subunit delta [Corynebacterium maris]AGS35466.1 hypothetical protein B841_09970 [Corynebacterium maris DSM 45190]